MFSWNITNPDITGNDKEDIRELKKKIDEMNTAMRVLVVQLKKVMKTEGE